MHCRELCDGLYDATLLLCRVKNYVEWLYVGEGQQMSTVILANEFDEIFISLNEIWDLYANSDFACEILTSRIRHYNLTLSETFSIICARPIGWLSNRYVLASSIVRYTLALKHFVNREISRLEKIAERNGD